MKKEKNYIHLSPHVFFLLKKNNLGIMVMQRLHLTITASLLSSVVSFNDSGLAFISLRECKTTLLAHTLNLANLANSLLELLHPWSVICNVVLLDFLNIMVRQRTVHSLVVLERKVTDQAHEWETKEHRPKDQSGIQGRQNSLVFRRDVNHRRNSGISREKSEPQQK